MLWETDLRQHWYYFCQRMFLPMLSPKSFMVSCLRFRSLSHFEFIFVHGLRVCSNFIDLHMLGCCIFVGYHTFGSPIARHHGSLLGLITRGLSWFLSTQTHTLTSPLWSLSPLSIFCLAASELKYAGGPGSLRVLLQLRDQIQHA